MMMYVTYHRLALIFFSLRDGREITLDLLELPFREDLSRISGSNTSSSNSQTNWDETFQHLTLQLE